MQEAIKFISKVFSHRNSDLAMALYWCQKKISTISMYFSN